MEIEAKLALSKEEAHQLQARLGRPHTVHHQRDYYFLTPGLEVALRVRQEDEHAWVTLKSGFSQVNGIRLREELEPVIQRADVPLWLALFETLGFKRGAEVVKLRYAYMIHGVQVVLDEVEGLGFFVEVEVLADEAGEAVAQLEAAIAQLDLAHLPRESKSYKELLKASRV